MIDSSALEIKLVAAAVYDTTIPLSCCAICGHCRQPIMIEKRSRLEEQEE